MTKQSIRAMWTDAVLYDHSVAVDGCGHNAKAHHIIDWTARFYLIWWEKAPAQCQIEKMQSEDKLFWLKAIPTFDIAAD